MHDDSLEGMHVVDPLRCCPENVQSELPRHLQGEVIQDVLEGSLVHKLGDDAKVGPFDAGANEQDDVGMMKLREEGHLCTELQHAPLVEFLLDETLHRHIDTFPFTFVHDTVAAHAHLVVVVVEVRDSLVHTPDLSQRTLFLALVIKIVLPVCLVLSR